MLPLSPSLEEFTALSHRHNLVAVWVELAADFLTPVAAFRALVKPGEYGFLLESAENHQVSGRYSILGIQPREVITARGTNVTIEDAQGQQTPATVTESDPLRTLEARMKKYQPAPQPELPVFRGGAVGYLAYDAVRYFEPTVPQAPPDSIGVPDMAYMISDTVVVFDHRFRTVKIVVNVFSEDHADIASAYQSAQSRIEQIKRQMEQPQSLTLMPADSGVKKDEPAPVAESNMTRERFIEIVKAGQEYIKAGDIFQFVPSQRFVTPFDGSPIDLFRALRHVNPSPYMFCLQFPDGFSLVGSSPEVHVKCLDGRVAIRPIAGTRPRGVDEAADQALADELIADPKERAEHIMLVDLARNDVGRAAEFGSVKVDDLMIIERYSHVMHIVSNVSGRLRPGCSAYDVMAATFPAGTVSGSPKVRAMQIINELEPAKRCAYGGAVGYFGFDGNLDSCIALRTCVLKDGHAYVQAGAGVVADSVPESEYQETVNKARAVLRGIERARTLKGS